MSRVIIGLSTSADGIAGAGPDGDEQDFWRVHNAVLGWVFELRSWRSAAGMDGGEDNENSRLWAEEHTRIGAQIVGRRMFDFSVDMWGDDPPFHVPVFVPTHRPQEPIVKAGGTTYTFVTGGISEAVARAKEAADGKDVLIAGGLDTAQRALRAGVVDELSMHITPVLVAKGARLLDALGEDAILLKPTRVVGSDIVTHVRYDVLAVADSRV